VAFLSWGVIPSGMALEHPIVFYVTNNKGGKSDGATFTAEARNFQQLYNVHDSDMIGLDTARLSKSARRQVVATVLEQRWGYGYDSVVFFGHGGKTWSDLGYNLQNVDQFAVAMADALDPDAVVVLYACLNADGPGFDSDDPDERVAGSFAEVLHNAMCDAGLDRSRVLGHTSMGHATENPYLMVIGPCGQGASWYSASPGEPGWSDWAHKMKMKGDYDLLVPSYLEDVDYKKVAEQGDEGAGAIAVAFLAVAAGALYVWSKRRR